MLRIFTAPLLLLTLASPATPAVFGKDKSLPNLQNQIFHLQFTGEDAKAVQFESLARNYEFKLGWHDAMIHLEGHVQPIGEDRGLLQNDLLNKIPAKTDKGTQYSKDNCSSRVVLKEGRKLTVHKQGPWSFGLSWEKSQD